MKPTTTSHPRRIAPSAGRRLMATAGAAAALALAAPAAAQAHANAMPPHHDATRPAAAHPTSRAALHDRMRALWEQHVAWTRLAIVAFAAGAPDLPATEARLLRNQRDIGDAIAPFYGRAAGRALTKLLEEHIMGAVAVLQAAKAGDAPALASAKAAWYANGREVADFLSAANPRHWPRAEMRSMMRTHLDQTLTEAVHELSGRYAASVRTYDAIERHILAMADELSRGIVRQFPKRFG
ncbi:MAG TPA: hypothetical protein VFR97_15600 [Capillimicrobium sp.]|nr:hypothetical protein [Capillimicrobium sp.]